VGTFSGDSSAGRVHEIGDALVTVVQQGDRVAVLHSFDGAQSWEAAPVAGITVLDGESEVRDHGLVDAEPSTGGLAWSRSSNRSRSPESPAASHRRTTVSWASITL